MLNEQLLNLARLWRKQLESCNEDKQSIWNLTYGAHVPAQDPTEGEKKPWWKFNK